LRDLHAEDYEKACLIDQENPMQIIETNIIAAFKKRHITYPEQVEIFFSVMEIESWMLAFTAAVSKWGQISQEDVLKTIRIRSGSNDGNIEKIGRPSSVIKEIGKLAGKLKPKSYKELMAFFSSITREDIQSVYESSQNKSFIKFWNKSANLHAGSLLLSIAFLFS
jgi:hypothetical protein